MPVCDSSSRRLPERQPAPNCGCCTSGTTRMGVALEVMAVELEDGSLLVIHAMRLREKNREQYEEATRWRR
ncbi:MAG TPA: hypothetical protein VGT60_06340 [Candidatus Limnocylindria bacterium]|nr:hypothetical protein [Candidatus Limnocylindria bacterium]